MTDLQSSHVDPRFAQCANQFFVLGGQKCGSTWLHDYFARHPNVCVPAWKELNYWSRLEGFDANGYLRSVHKERFKSNKVRLQRLLGRVSPTEKFVDKGILAAMRLDLEMGAPHTAYADAVFQRSNDESVAWGEACPQYARLQSSTYAQMMQLTGNAKFVFVMRDPLARFISSAKHEVRLEGGTVDAVTPAFADRLMAKLDDVNCWPHFNTLYDDTITQLEAAVPADQIQYFFFEELFTDANIAKLCAFLDVPMVPPNLATKINADPKPPLVLPAEIKQRIVDKFAHVYAAINDKFGADVPAVWHTSFALRSSGALQNG